VPVAVTVRVTFDPSVIEDAEAEKELIEGPLAAAENMIACDALAAFTVIIPERGLAAYPGTGPIVYAYVPFGSANVTVVVVEAREVP